MDVQLKRGLLEVCVLSAVYRDESYGYQIIRDLSGHIEISESTLYPILRRLETAGALTVTSREHNGRLRKYYVITDKGRDKVREFLEEWKQMTDVYEYIRGEVEET